MPAPPNRPFFANFFAAFRAQSSLPRPGGPVGLTQAAAAGSPTSPAVAGGTSSASASSPRPINTKSNATSAAVAAAAAHQFRHQGVSPSPAVGPQSPAPSASAFHQQPNRSRTPSETRGGQLKRRASNSSCSSASSGGGPMVAGKSTMGGAGGGAGAKGGSNTPLADGFAGGNWYVGGRTPSGDERFYKLGMVKRYNSEERLSVDRLSL